MLLALVFAGTVLGNVFLKTPKKNHSKYTDSVAVVENKINLIFLSRLCGGKNKIINTNIYYLSRLCGSVMIL